MATESTPRILPTFEPLEGRMFLSASFYIAANGSDANPGTLAAPFATLDRAQTAIRDLKTTTGLPSGGVTVYIRGGKYTRASTFALTSSDSGASDKPIVWTSYNNEPVEITGGVKLDPSWFSTVSSSSPIWGRVNAAARGNLMQVDLKAHGITDFGTLVKRSTWKWNGSSPLELFFEGDRMQLGRYPNAGFARTVTAPSSSSFTYTDPRLDTWSSANDVWFYGFFGTLWESANVNGTINTSTNTVTLSAAPQYGVKANMPYFAYNILEEVDTPGEYYLDRSSGMLYFWAPESMAGKSIYASMLKSNVLSMSSTSYVTFSGITFEMSRAGLVSISGGSHNTLENCILRDSGGNGAVITGASNGLEHCQVYEIGDMAVSLDGGTRSTLTAAGNFVRNTAIHDYAQWVGTNRQGIAVHGVGQVIAHNEIYNGPDAAIQFWGNNHLFEYNDIHDVCRTINDAGAIYSGRDWSYQGNVLRYNFIHDINSTLNNGTNLYGIYLDDAMSQVDIYGSIFYNIGGSGIFSAGGRDNHITNNIFANNYTGVLADRRGTAIIDNVSGSDCNFLQKLNTAAGGDFHAGAWAKAYPNLQIIPNDFNSLGDLKNPGGSKLVGNLGYSNTKGFKREGSWGGYGAFSWWASVTNNVENADPQFVDAAGGNFNVKSSSPVNSIPGWKTIPFDQIGIEASPVQPPPDQPPVAKDDALSLNQDTSANTPNVLANDTDPDGDVLAITAFSQAQHGGVVNNNNGTFKYTPAAGYVGTDIFSYTISDGKGGTASANVNITVQAVNHPPVANPDVATTNQDTAVTTPNVLANDTDPDGDALTVSAFTQPQHGSAAGNNDGTFTYTPAAGYTGPDAFGYTVSDGKGGTASANVTITVLAVNHPPVANADSATTAQDKAVTTCNVLANDTDPDGDTLSVSAFTQASHGTVANNNNGTFTYTPASGFAGSDSFTYTVSDGRGSTASAPVNVTVTAVVPPPPPPPANDGIIVDNKGAGFTTTGKWAESAASDEYAGSSITTMQIGAKARWTPVLPSAGGYKVYVWYSDKKSDGTAYVRDSAANYTVNYKGGSQTFNVDQNVASGQWVLLGTFNFDWGTAGYVEVLRDAASGIATCADAVKFVPVTAVDVIVDNKGAGFAATGKWNASAAVDSYAAGSVTSMNVGDKAKWTPTLPQAGTYNVYVWYSDKKSDGTLYSRDAAAAYTVTYKGGTKTFSINQNANFGQWVLLGSFQFDAGTGGFVDLVRSATSGVSTCADAVKFSLVQ